MKEAVTILFITIILATSVAEAFHIPGTSQHQRKFRLRIPSSDRTSIISIRHSYWSIHSTAVIDDNESDSGRTIPSGASVLEGTSPKAIKLRKQVQAVINDPSNTSPIILHGPSGAGSKTEIAEEIISRLPSWQTQKVHRLSLDDGVDYIDTVLGNTLHPGILDDLSLQHNTTLLLKGFNSPQSDSKEEFDRKMELVTALARLVSHKEFYSIFANHTIEFLPRIIGCTQSADYFKQFLGVDAETNIDATFISVPSVQSRTKDLKDISKIKIKLLEGNFGLQDVQLSREAIKRLLDHRWGVEGAAELDSELYKALKQLKLEKRWNLFAPNMIKSRHVLVDSEDERIRNRLLYNVPGLRKIIMTPWVFDHTLRYIVTPAFIAIVAILFVGPQDREHSAALTLFWAGWWPGIMIVFPFLGRIWCTVCPFMAIGTLAQEFVTSMDIHLKKWPIAASTIGPAFAFFLFAAILMWEELWDLPQNGALSSCLLLLITAGAVVGSVIYEKRVWCRYFCPIGAMNKIFAMPAMTEIRTWKANCEGCTNPTCKVGGSSTLDPTDTFAIKGCTMDLKNNQLRDMGDCVMCMSCVKNCDREAPEFNLRPIGVDFGLPWLLPSKMQKDPVLAPSQVETNFWLGGIITILQGSVFLHYLPKLLVIVGIDPSIATEPPALNEPFFQHAALAFTVLALPGTVGYVADELSKPLESLVLVWKREFTKRPAENAAIVRLYETLLERNTDIAQTMKEFMVDVDGDGIVSKWEMKEAFKQLDIPDYQHQLLEDVLLPSDDDSIPVPTLLDNLQELYFDIKEAKQEPTYKSIVVENELETKLTFIEIFNKLDKEGRGFITKEQFASMSDLGYFKIPLSETESSKLFDRADFFQSGRLNLFEFMSILRKTVKVGIQEIGYGYLPFLICCPWCVLEIWPILIHN